MMINTGMWLGDVFRDYSNIQLDCVNPGHRVQEMGCVYHVPLCDEDGGELMTFEFSTRKAANAFKRELKALIKEAQEAVKVVNNLG